MRTQLRDRAFLPLAIPLGILAFIFLMTFGLSRILLNVPKEVATAVALMTALNVLIVFSVITLRDRLAGSQILALLVVAAVPIFFGGAVATGAISLNETKEGGPTTSAKTIAISASSLQFDKKQLDLSEGEKQVLKFDNKDTQPHNIAIFESADANGKKLFTGDIVQPSSSANYNLPSLNAGSYFFHCDIHPTMTGTVVVAAKAAASPAQSQAGANLALTAKNLKFDTASLEFPANQEVSLTFKNEDSGVPHNVGIFKGGDVTGTKVFSGNVVTGPVEEIYKIPPLPAGEYFFHCDIHPSMSGKITTR